MKPDTHPTANCWAPGRPKHDPNRQHKSNQRAKEQAHRADEDNDEDNDDNDGGTMSMNIHIDRSFIAKQSNSNLLYVPLPELSNPLITPQAYIAKGLTKLSLTLEQLLTSIMNDRISVSSIKMIQIISWALVMDQSHLPVAAQPQSGQNLPDEKVP